VCNEDDTYEVFVSISIHIVFPQKAVFCLSLGVDVEVYLAYTEGFVVNVFVSD